MKEYLVDRECRRGMRHRICTDFDLLFRVEDTKKLVLVFSELFIRANVSH